MLADLEHLCDAVCTLVDESFYFTTTVNYTSSPESGSLVPANSDSDSIWALTPLRDLLPWFKCQSGAQKKFKLELLLDSFVTLKFTAESITQTQNKNRNWGHKFTFISRPQKEFNQSQSPNRVRNGVCCDYWTSFSTKHQLWLGGFHIWRPHWGGVRKYPNCADKWYIKFGQREGGRHRWKAP